MPKEIVRTTDWIEVRRQPKTRMDAPVGVPASDTSHIGPPGIGQDGHYARKPIRRTVRTLKT
jgi:hypothetical protein